MKKLKMDPNPPKISKTVGVPKSLASKASKCCGEQSIRILKGVRTDD